MILDVRLTPNEMLRVKRILLDGVNVTSRVVRLDTVTGTVWLLKVRDGKIARPFKEECRAGEIVVQWADQPRLVIER